MTDSAASSATTTLADDTPQPDTAAGTSAAVDNQDRTLVPLLAVIAVGAAVSVALGVYGRVHEPTGDTIATFGFPAVLPMKAWFATGAAALALGQLTSALWLWGRLPGAGAAPGWVGPFHRWSGTVAFFLTLPVGYHCLWALGFRDTDTRVLVHSILGCAFYGAFTTKLLSLRVQRLPGLTLPVVGGTLVALLVGLWWTSSLWFFTNVGFPGI